MDTKILSKEPISMPEVADHAAKIGKVADLLDMQNKMRLHAKELSRLGKDDAEKLVTELKALDIIRLSKEQLVQIVSLLPRDVSELRAVLSGEKTTIKPDDLQRIVDVVKKFVKA